METPTPENQEVFEMTEMSNIETSKEERVLTDEEIFLSVDQNLLKQLEEIPQKMAFKIGDVAELAGVKQYVLRYWETEFDVLRPKKSNHNQRMYTRNDVEIVLLIKKLLYIDKYSISGARTAIRKLKKRVKSGSLVRESYRKYSGAINRARLLVQRIERLQDSLA